MTDRAQLESLRDRLVAATGPDREIDCYLHAALVLRGPVRIIEPPTYDPRRFFCLPTAHAAMDWIGYDLLNVAPAYTASLDAAETLTPPDLACEAITYLRSEGTWHVEWYEPGKPANEATCSPDGIRSLSIAFCLARAEHELAKPGLA